MPPYSSQDSPESRGRLEFRLTLLVILVSVALMQLPADVHDPMSASIRATVLRPFLAMQAGMRAADARSRTAVELQARIDTLTGVLVSRTTLEEENRRLRGLMELSGRVGPRWRAVQVLRPGTPESESTLLLQVGRREGLAPRSPIITREGLAGVVVRVDEHEAVGMDWTHRDFRVSAMTLDGLQYGIVQVDFPRLGDGSRFLEAARLRLDGLPFHAEVDSGTVVVTSGLGGVFPRGIPIGRVVGVAQEEAEWRKSLWLEPLVPVGSVTVALVAVDGEGGEGPADLSAVWEGTGYLREDQRLIREVALEDSLRLLRDSLSTLERRLDPGVGGGG